MVCRLLLGLLLGLLSLRAGGADVRAEAEFAVSELSSLSDSGVYETLSLSRVVSAREEDGLFHDNLVLTLALASPHFASGKSEEEFEVVVMTHKEDGIKSIAIDEFPIMSESSIEAFYERRVVANGKEREEAFRRLEIEAIFGNEIGLESALDENAAQVKQMVDGASVKSHLDNLDTPEMRERRKSESLLLLAQLPKKYANEENDLQNMSLSDLYSISLGEIEASNFQKTRAVDILDTFLQLASIRRPT